jgi:NAD(P)-dependent dehydrogenase (short-subunit alcohol dehydrogenase family)
VIHLGPLKLAKACASKLKKGAKYGIITSRMGSITDNTSGGQYGYRLSKAAANAVGKSLSEDFRSQGVTVLMLHPGYVKTDMTGGSGLIDTTESADGLFKILNEKGFENTGTFWHMNGEMLPW